MRGIINYLRKLKRMRALKNIDNCKTLSDIAIHTIKKNRLKQLSFLEIGVFKGDTAINLALNIENYYNIKINYFGFDLFDDIDYLQEKYPEDFKQYNSEEYPYWEFKSGEHNYSKVVQKLSSVMGDDQFKLFKGDTTKTLPDFIQNASEPIDLIYLDGCHDYDVVKSDWGNCALLFSNNPKLIILFDDYTYDGVKAVHDEILNEGQHQIKHINGNQFIVFLDNPTVH